MSGQSNQEEEENKPPSKQSPDPLRFIIARDGSKNWIVMEAHGLYGGVFVSRDAAIHFADFECRNRDATFELMTGRSERLERKNGKLHSQH